jgi:hypothetical protein
MNSSDGSKAFKFKGSIAGGAVIVGLAIGIWGITVASWISRGSSAEFWGFLALSVFLSAAALIFLNSTADLVFSDKEISRKIGGKIWQSIEWDQVKEIKVFPVFDGKNSRGFNVIPKAGSSFSLMPHGKISFIDRAKDRHGLVETLNHYVAAHGIRVCVKTLDGRTLTANQIEQ